jgi:hypothetical protein
VSTATVPIKIVCPDWCTVSPEDHARNLWDMGGDCIHRSMTVGVEDPTGYREALAEPRFHDRIELSLSTSANPETNRETASAVVYLGDRDHSIAQALALAEAITAQVAAYREAGGIE